MWQDKPINLAVASHPIFWAKTTQSHPRLLQSFAPRKSAINDMLPPLIHQGRDRTVPEVIEAPADQRKALRRPILDRRGEREFALKPRFDRMLVGRGHIGEMAGHQRARVPGNDLLREEVFWRRAGPERLHPPHEEHTSGERGADPQPRPGPHARAGGGPAGPAHGGSHALLYMLWRGKR